MAGEEGFGFVEEALGAGVDVGVAEFGEFLEFGFLGVIEMGGDFDGDAGEEVAGAVALDVFDAVAFEAEDGVVLGAGGDFDVGLAGEGGDFEFSAEGGLDEADGDFADEVVVFAGEDFVGFDVEDDVEVAVGAALEAGFAVAGGAKAGAGVDAGGDAEFDLGGAFAAALAAAGGAGFFDNAAGAFAAGAGLGDAEDAAGHDDLAASAAVLAGFFAGAGGGAGAVAGVAGVEFGDGDVAFAAEGGFFEAEFEVVAEVGAALGAAGFAAAAGVAKEFVEDAAAAGGGASAEGFAEDVEGVVEAAAAGAAAGAGAGVEGGVSVLVVGGAFLGVADGFVGFAEFLEFFLGGLVAGVFVGVVFDGEFAVGLFDVVVGGVAGDAEDFVVIPFGHRSGGGFFGDDDGGGAEKAVAEAVAFAELLEDVAFGDVGGLGLGDGFVEVGVEGFAGGVDFFEAGVGDGGLELAVDHVDAGFKGVDGGGLGLIGGGEGHLEVVEDGEEFLEEGLGGGLGGVLAFAGGAFLEILEVGGLAEVAVPVFVGFGGFGPEFLKLLGGEGFRGRRGRGVGGGLRGWRFGWAGRGISFVAHFEPLQGGRLHNGRGGGNCVLRVCGGGWLAGGYWAGGGGCRGLSV